VKQVLTTNLEEAAEQESKIENEGEDIVDQIAKEMKERGPQETLSYYAFTATPKKKTRRLFGVKISNDDYRPFHFYSMKQAIEEGFILDVLKNYTTYERYLHILKTASEDKVVEGKKASRPLLKYVDLHHLNLQNKAKIIVEHFREHTQPKIGGLAKAMVVGSSRQQVLRYKQEIDEYFQKQGYQGIKTLVAFSSLLKDDTGPTVEGLYTAKIVGENKENYE
jgi:type I restriction enzyme R subunit